MKSILTVFLPSKEVHLYKDVGMIPYSLSRYCNYKAALAYLGNDTLEDQYFEKYVQLIKIANSCNIFIKIYKYIVFAYKYSHKFDIVNFYHLSLKNIFLPILFKLFNSKCKIYLKLDLDVMNYNNLCCDNSMKRKLLNKLKLLYIKHIVDFASVETKKYFNEIKNQNNELSPKIYYVPDGCLMDYFDLTNMHKENIIMTVGRLGTRQKNNELLVDTIAKLPIESLIKWKVYFVGPYTEAFFDYVKKTIDLNPYLKDIIVMTGNLNKKDLFELYRKSKIFCLTSRWESFGLVIPEAMAFENYVISTEYDAIYDLLDNGKYGDILKKNVENELHDLLSQYIIDDMQLTKVASQGKKYVLEAFDWKNIAKKLDIILMEK